MISFPSVLCSPFPSPATLPEKPTLQGKDLADPWRGKAACLSWFCCEPWAHPGPPHVNIQFVHCTEAPGQGRQGQGTATLLPTSCLARTSSTVLYYTHPERGSVCKLSALRGHLLSICIKVPFMLVPFRTQFPYLKIKGIAATPHLI